MRRVELGALFSSAILAMAFAGCGGTTLPNEFNSFFSGSELNSGNPYDPKIQLRGSNPVDLSVGENYQEPGASVYSFLYGDISSQLRINASSVNTARAGIYVVTYTIVDADQRSASATRQVRVGDFLPPTLQLLGLNPLSLERGSAYVEPGFRALDNVDGDISSKVLVTGSLNTSVVGAYTLTYKVSDAAGNAAPSLQRIINVVDTLKPNLTIDSPAANTQSNGPLVISGLCEPSIAMSLTGAQISGSLSCQSSGHYSANIILSGANGTKTINIRQTDLSNNASSVSRDFIYDSQSPILSIDSPSANALTNGSINLQGSCESGLALTISGAQVIGPSVCSSSRYSLNLALQSPDGNKTVGVSQTDSAGNTSSVSRGFILDATAPNLTIEAPAANTSTSGALTLSGACENNLPISISGAQLNGSLACSASHYSASVNLSGADGNKTITLSQTDLAGNLKTVSRIFILDTGGPVLTIDSPAAGTLTQGAVLISGACENGSTLQVSGAQLSGSIQCSNQRYTASVSLQGTDGLKMVTVTARDAAQNLTSVSRSFELDKTPPVITLQGLAIVTLNVCDSFVDPGATATDRNQNLSVVISGQVLLRERGTYNLTYSATDFVGNTSSVIRTVKIQSAIGDEEVGLIDLSASSLIRLPANASKSFLLCSDIILGNGMSPIGSAANPFRGHLNGNYKKIKDGSIISNSDLVGLFASIEKTAVVEKLILENIQVDAPFSSNVGSLAGYSIGDLSEIAVLSGAGGFVKGFDRVGGLVGENDSNGDQADDRGDVLHSFTNLPVYGITNVGGLVGENKGKVIETFSHSPIYANGLGARNMGGLIGINQQTDGNDVHHSYALGISLGIQSATNTGGLIGRGKNSVVTESYWNLEKSGIDQNGADESRYGQVLGDLEMQDSAHFEDFFVNWGTLGDVWVYDLSLSPYPIFRWFQEHH